MSNVRFLQKTGEHCCPINGKKLSDGIGGNDGGLFLPDNPGNSALWHLALQNHVQFILQIGIQNLENENNFSRQEPIWTKNCNVLDAQFFITSLFFSLL